jgi:hypothetical protein
MLCEEENQGERMEYETLKRGLMWIVEYDVDSGGSEEGGGVGRVWLGQGGKFFSHRRCFDRKSYLLFLWLVTDNMYRTLYFSDLQASFCNYQIKLL